MEIMKIFNLFTKIQFSVNTYTVQALEEYDSYSVNFEDDKNDDDDNSKNKNFKKEDINTKKINNKDKISSIKKTSILDKLKNSNVSESLKNIDISQLAENSSELMISTSFKERMKGKMINNFLKTIVKKAESTTGIDSGISSHL